MLVWSGSGIPASFPWSTSGQWSSCQGEQRQTAHLRHGQQAGVRLHVCPHQRGQVHKPERLHEQAGRAAQRRAASVCVRAGMMRALQVATKSKQGRCLPEALLPLPAIGWRQAARAMPCHAAPPASGAGIAHPAPGPPARPQRSAATPCSSHISQDPAGRQQAGGGQGSSSSQAALSVKDRWPPASLACCRMPKFLALLLLQCSVASGRAPTTPQSPWPPSPHTPRLPGPALRAGSRATPGAA